MSSIPSRHRFVPAGSSLRRSNYGERGNIGGSSRRKEALILTLHSARIARHLFETPYVVSYGPHRWPWCQTRCRTHLRSRLAAFLIHTPLQQVFRRVVIRNNIIRYADGLNEDHIDPAANIGIGITMAEDVIVENNIIDLDRPDPLQYRDCTHVHYFNNTNSSGKYITGEKQPPLLPATNQNIAKDIAVLVKDALLLSIM